MPIRKPDPIEDKSTDAVKRVIARLKKELLEAQMKANAYQRVIEIAEKNLKIPIRKKYHTK